MELCFGPTLSHGQEVGGPKQTAQVWAGCPWGRTGGPVPSPGAFSQSQARRASERGTGWLLLPGPKPSSYGPGLRQKLCFPTSGGG